MKAQPINIIGEHLLLVTTWGEQERAAIHQPHWRVSVWGGVGGESPGTELAHPSLNPGRPGYRVHVWSRHLPASAGPQPPLANGRENAPVDMKNASGRVHLLSDADTHTHTLTLSSGNPPFTIRKAGMALILDPAQADDERCLVDALLKFAH